MVLKAALTDPVGWYGRFVHEFWNGLFYCWECNNLVASVSRKGTELKKKKKRV